MEKHHSVQFFTSLVEAIQGIVQESFHFNQFVEIGGYISVEIDNVKKERYVLSELLQSSGNVVSESFCVKAFETFQNTTALSRGNSMHRKPLQKRPCTVQVIEDSPYDTHTVKSTVNYQTKPTNCTRSKIDQFPIPEYNDEKESASATEIQCYVPSVFESSKSSAGQRIKARTYVPPICRQQSDTYEEHQGTPIQPGQAAHVPSEEANEVFDDEHATDDMDAEGCSHIEDINQSMSGTSSESCATFSSTTQSLIRRSVRQFKIFLFMKYRKVIDLVSCPPKRLDSFIMEYFMEAKKQGGGEFRAKSLKCMMQRLDMFLRDLGYPHSLFKADEFKTCREYIKKKTSTESAPVSMGYVFVDEDDVETMFQMQQLGCHSLEVLTNTMWLMNSLYLRLKSPNQHFSLKWGDVVLRTDGDEEYLERYVDPSCSFKLKAKPENPSRCFVNFYKQFRALRPKLAMDDEHPFYLKHNKSDLHDSTYILEPMPCYILRAMWKKLQTNALLPLNKKIF